METLTKQVLKNNKCIIEYTPETKKILGRDLTDPNNLPAFYNKTVRSIRKAWAVLEKKFNEETTMREARNILVENKIRCHSWCMMD